MFPYVFADDDERFTGDFSSSLTQEDEMAFGRPTRYLQLDLNRIPTSSNSNTSNARATWDKSVEQASDQYKKTNGFFILRRLFFFFICLCMISAQSLL